jgi:hypothetical protein
LKGFTPRTALLLILGAGVFAMLGCRKVATQPQCDAIVDRYVDLVVRASPDAGAVEETKKKVREMAEADEDFRSCTTHVEVAQYECAMKAMTPEAIEKCLE